MFTLLVALQADSNIRLRLYVCVCVCVYVYMLRNVSRAISQKWFNVFFNPLCSLIVSML